MSDFKSVEVLRVDAAGLNNLDEIIPKLKQFLNLRRLYLRRNNLRNIPSLAFLPRLELLDLSGNPEIDDVNLFIENLRNNENISYLTCKFSSEDDEDNVIVDLPTLKIVNGMVAGEGDEDMPKPPELGNDLQDAREQSQPNQTATADQVPRDGEHLSSPESPSSSRSATPNMKFNRSDSSRSGSTSRAQSNQPRNETSEMQLAKTATPPPNIQQQVVFPRRDESSALRLEQLRSHQPVYNSNTVTANPEVEQLGREPSVVCGKFFKQIDSLNGTGGKQKGTLNWREELSSTLASTKSALYSTLTKETFTEEAAKCKCTLSEALIWVSTVEIMNKQLSKQIPAISIYIADSMKALLQVILKAISELRTVEGSYEYEVEQLQERCRQGEKETNALLEAAELLEQKVNSTTGDKISIEQDYQEKLEKVRSKLLKVAKERDDAIELNRKYEELLNLSTARQGSVTSVSFAASESSMMLPKGATKSQMSERGNKINVSQLSHSQVKEAATRGRQAATVVTPSPMTSSQIKRQGRIGTMAGPMGLSSVGSGPAQSNMETFMANYKGPRILSVKMLNDFVSQIIESKMNYEVKRERVYNSLKKNDPRALMLPNVSLIDTTSSTTTVPLPETMEQHLYTFLCHKYGLKYLVLEWADSILASIAKHSVERKRIMVVGGEDGERSRSNGGALMGLTNTVPLYPRVVAFSHILRSECEESFLDVLAAVRSASIELLLARVKAANPLKGDKWAMEEVEIKTGDVNTNTKNNQLALTKQPKRPGTHTSFMGFLTEIEWMDIVKYMYSREDATEIIGRCRMAAEAEMKESGIGGILRIGASNPDRSMAETSLIGISRRSIAELRRSLKEHPTAYLRFDTFICIMQGFQLEGHLRFLSPFVEKFKEIDTDRDGVLNELDFRHLCSLVCIDVTSERLDELADLADPYGSNAITFSKCVDVLHNDLVRNAQECS